LVTNVKKCPKSKNTLKRLVGLVGKSVLTSHGADHSRQRAYLSPAFHFANFEKFHKVFNECASKLCETLKSDQKERNVDISEAMTKMTLDIIGLTAFGYNFNALGDGQNEMVSAYNTVFASTGYSLINYIFSWWEKIPTSENLRVQKARDTIRSKVVKIIDEKRQECDNSDEATELLGIMLRQTGIDENGNDISAKEVSSTELMDNVMTFLVAGHETTATTLCWALHLLSVNPETQLRVQAELDAVLGDKQPTLEQMATLPLLRATVDETLRLFPAAAFTSRTALEDDVIDGHFIPAGTVNIVFPRIWVGQLFVLFFLR
jgi:cytochrome P450